MNKYPPKYNCVITTVGSLWRAVKFNECSVTRSVSFGRASSLHGVFPDSLLTLFTRAGQFDWCACDTTNEGLPWYLLNVLVVCGMQNTKVQE